jgi:hypothetical protein
MGPINVQVEKKKQQGTWVKNLKTGACVNFLLSLDKNEVCYVAIIRVI